MSEGKKRRYRKIKSDDKCLTRDRLVIIAKRDDDKNTVQKLCEAEIHPKILLRTKIEKGLGDDEVNPICEFGPQFQKSHKIMTAPGDETAHSPTININTTKEQLNSEVYHTIGTSQLCVEDVPVMARPSTVISSTGNVNCSIRKLLMRTNTDFLVVGVVGMQGVGKSTIMNLLANEKLDYAYNSVSYAESEHVFPTKPKHHKCCSRPRTESMHMYITSDRIILLDTPPVLCNPYKKDLTSTELDDLRVIINLYSVCHLVIVVFNDYLNINLIRLLKLAAILKPTQIGRTFTSDYFPNILFIKNRAKIAGYIPDQKEKLDDMLKTFFKHSQLRIFLWQIIDQRQRKGRLSESEQYVNSFLFPEIDGTTTQEYIEKLRALVFMAPRNEIGTCSSELTEFLWFDLLIKISQEMQHFFLNTYEEIERRHLEIGGANLNNLNCTNSKDINDV